MVTCISLHVDGSKKIITKYGLECA